MSAVEQVVVGRKTAGDGKLEVSPEFARVLGGDGATVDVHLASGVAQGSVVVMPCTCAKAGASGKHEHYFVQSDAFRELVAGTALRLEGWPMKCSVSA